MLSYEYEGEPYFVSTCYKTYCLPDGKMVITINENDNVNITCNETGQTINLNEFNYFSLVCPNIA